MRTVLPLVLTGLFCGTASAAPTVTSFSPTFGAFGDPNPIIIKGSGFSPGTVVVKFNGVAAPGAAAVDEGTIQATVPSGAAIGSGPIYVSVGGVPTQSQDDFTVIGAGPYISNFSPQAGGAGGLVTITGAHFTASMVVRFNGVATNATAASSTVFDVRVPPGATSGLISVSNSLGKWTSTNNFYVLPFITGFSPTNGRAGTNVTITGTNFLGTTSVQFSNVSASSYTVLNNNSIQVTAPVGVLSGLVRVSGPAGTAFSANRFIVPPTVYGFTPIFGGPGASITVTGANFNVGTPTVKFGGINATTVSNISFNLLNAVVPPGATSAPISVITADGTGIGPGLFYLPPRITSFTPTNSLPGSTVTISGTNFTDASAVSFNGTPATQFTVTNNNTIGVIVPGNFTTGPISITTPAGTSNTLSLATSNFYAVPIVSGFSPPHGLPGTNVTVFGSSFLGALAVQFQAAGGGTTNAAILSVSNSQVRVVVPNNAVSGPITVVGPAGSSSSSFNFVLDYATLLVNVNDNPDPVTVGSNLVYTILIQNSSIYSGAVSLTNILPPSVTFVSSTAGTTVSNVTVANLGVLNFNDIASVTITAKPNTPNITITNRAIAVTGPTPTEVLTTTVVEGPLPTLLVSFNPPNAVLLSWPSVSSNFTLQFNSNPTSTNWQNVLTTPVSSGGTNTITQTNLGAAMFYRLKK